MIGIVLDIPAKQVIEKGSGKLLLTKEPDIDCKKLILLEDGLAYGVVEFGKRESHEKGTVYPMEVVEVYSEPKEAEYSVNESTSLADISSLKKQSKKLSSLELLNSLVEKSSSDEALEDSYSIPQEPTEASLNLHAEGEKIYLDVIYSIDKSSCGTLRFDVTRDAVAGLKDSDCTNLVKCFSTEGSRFTKALDTLGFEKLSARNKFWLSAEGEVPCNGGKAFIGKLGKATIQHDGYSSIFVVSKVFNGVFKLGEGSAEYSSSVEPPVLNSKVDVGKSGLPKSAEVDVPPTYRWWAASDATSAEILKGLFKSKIDGTFDVVDGDVRFLRKKYFLAKYDDKPLSEVEKVVDKLKSSHDKFISLTDGSVEVEDAVSMLKKVPSGDSFVIEHTDTPKNRYYLNKVGPLFSIIGSDLLYCASSLNGIDNYAISKLEAPEETHIGNNFTSVKEVSHDKMVSQFLSSESVLKALEATSNKDEKFVLGVVLEPEVVDAQDDIYSADEIRQSAHKFMQEFNNIGLMHKEIINDKVKVVETYLAPTDFKINGQSVKKGTWVLGVKVLDEDLWNLVKSGEITGFSIGGSAIRKPEN